MNIVDLFSGAGGLTFGFKYELSKRHFRKTKNKILFANEFSSAAAHAYLSNFPDIKMLNQDIRLLKPECVKRLIGTRKIDLLIGGPPCQSFSTIGKRCFDEKARLYSEYLRLLSLTDPKMFLFENVKGLLSMREVFYALDENGNPILERIVTSRNGRKHIKFKPIIDHYGEKVIDLIERDFSSVGQFGYTLYKAVLNAADYGVPQNRERLFILGVRKDISRKWNWDSVFRHRVLQQISVKEAISDLPAVHEGEHVVDYDAKPVNDYQRLMRGRKSRLTQHFCGIYGEKMRIVLSNVRPGEGKNEFNALVDAGLVEEKYRLTSGFHNTYGRLLPDRPSTTITNNLCTPSGLRCIHYEQNRALTPREGARIQSFPDWFQFWGGRTEVTAQIGNAVPPLLAMTLAREIELFFKMC